MENIMKLRASINEAIDRDEYDASLTERLLAYRRTLLTLNGWTKTNIDNPSEIWKKDSAYLLMWAEAFTVTSVSLTSSYWYDNDQIFAVLVINL